MSLDPVRSGVDATPPRGCLGSIFFMLWNLAGDYPLRTGGALALLLTFGMADGVAMWVMLALVAVAVIAANYFLHAWEWRYRVKRRFVRAWRGDPNTPGVAYDLGLLNASKVPPKLKSYDWGDGHRLLTFTLPAGITFDQMANCSSELADALGGHRAQVVKLGPRLVEVRVMDTDSLQDARAAEWSRSVETDESTPRMPQHDDSVPFWLEEENQEEGEH